MTGEAETGIDAGPVRDELQRILSSKTFAAAGRSRTFLQYVVERTLAGAAPKEYEIAVDVLERKPDYDPEINATVRVEAGRLRQRLREFYETAAPSGVRIEIPKGGYCAVFTTTVPADIVPAIGEQTGDRILTTEEQPRIPSRATPSWRVSPMGIGIVAVLAVVTLMLFGPYRNPRLQAGGPIRSLAVLPLRDLSGGADQAYFAEGMTDALITELAQTPNLRVVSRTSAMEAAKTAQPLRRLGAALDVDAVVEGTVVRSGDRIRITAQLIDVRDDRHLWAESFEEKAGDVLTLQDAVARRIAVQTQAVLANTHGQDHRPVNPAAYDAYLRGLYFLHRREGLRSVSYLTQATTLDASYAPAHAALAEALASEVLLLNDPDPNAESKARAEAGRAIELDPNCGEGYAALSLVELSYTKDWEAAGRNLRKSLALNPNDSLAAMQMAVYLDATSRPEEAVAQMRRAVKLDPLSFFINRHLGSALYFARHYPQAVMALRRSAEMDPPRISLVDNWLSRSMEMMGDLPAAVDADMEGLRESFPSQEVGRLRTAYQQGGWKAYQIARAHLFEEHAKVMCSAFEVGESYLRVGDLDRAFAAFERGMDTNCFWQDSLAVNPMMDKARGDPRYLHLLRRAHMM